MIHSMRPVRRLAALLSLSLLLLPQLQAMASRCAFVNAPSHDMASMTGEGEMAMPMASEPIATSTPSGGAPAEECQPNKQNPSDLPCDGSAMPNGCLSIGACSQMAMQAAAPRLTFDLRASSEGPIALLELRPGIAPPPESPPPRA